MEKRPPFQIFRTVIFALVLREMRGRFGRLRMGAFWTVVEPILHILVISIIRVSLRAGGHSSIEFPMFLLTGLSPFILYRNIAQRLADSLDANRALFGYKQIQPFDTLVARVLVEFSLASVVYVVVLAAFGWYGYHIGVHRPLEWIGVLALGLLFAFSVGLTLAPIVNAMPELSVLVRLIFMPLYLISGVIIPVSIFPPEVLPYLLWNPFLHLMELLRYYVFPNYPIVDGVSLRYVVEVTLILLFVGTGVYRLRRRAMMAL